MSKAGMKRPGANSQPKTESKKHHSNKNVVEPVPEIKGKTK